MRVAAVLVALGILLFTSHLAYSGEAAPYTEEAYQAVERAFKQIGELQYPANAALAEKYKALIDYSRNAFAVAGYDYDATLRRILDDVINRRDEIPHHNPPKIFSVHLMGLGMMMEGCYRQAVDCLAFFPRDIATAIRTALPPELYRRDKK